jgi:gamma-glutamyltranspeptidase / glutathione hydrolase
MDPLRHDYPYATRRMPVLADHVVATSQPLAAQAGLQAMADGGNAVDAALATAIALTVVEPTSNGIGGDAFALVWDGDELHGLNASGRSPQRLDAERLGSLAAMPQHGWDPVTVPGAVSAWVTLAERFGRLPLERLVAPAARYARDGFPVGPMTAAAWARGARTFDGMPDFAAAFLPSGRAPAAGERFRFPDQATTLEAIAATRGEAFYLGKLAERMADHARAQGGTLRENDLAEHRATWVAPLRQTYRDIELVELPPNGQGLVALIALGILGHFDLASLQPDGAEAIHLQAEALKLAFADARRHLADPEAMVVPANGCWTPTTSRPARPSSTFRARAPSPAGRYRAAARSTSPRLTPRAAWSRSSSRTTWASAPEWSYPAPASHCRTAAPVSRPSRGTPTASQAASAPSTRSSRRSSCAGVRRSPLSASSADTSRRRCTSS